MQIREINLTELDLVYPLIQKKYPKLSFNEYEDLVYEMKKENYKILSIVERTEILAYIGLRVQTSIQLNKHLYITEFITDPEKFKSKYLDEIDHFLKIFAKTYMCKQIKYANSIKQSAD
jgi:hypothetical protein